MGGRLFCAAFLLTVLVGAGLRHTYADEPKPADLKLRPEDKAFFAWWDSLEYPDLGRLPFVEVTTGGWIQDPGEDPKPEVEHGFLVSEAAGTVRVFLTDLSTSVLTLQTVKDQPWKSVRKRPADLAAFVTQGLAARRAFLAAGPRWGPGVDPIRAHRWAVPDQSWRMLVLARACAARGREDLARALCDLAIHKAESAVLAASYHYVRAAMASEAVSVWEHRFGDIALSLEDLASEAERLGRVFEKDIPGPAGLAKRSAVELRMIARDVAAHRARRAAAGPPASEQERIADLVAVLPTVTEGWIRGPRGSLKLPPTPADELFAVGIPAVPALIGALGDLRFTRKLQHSYSHKGQRRDEWRVMRVNEVAYLTLQRLAAGALPELVVPQFGGYNEFPAVGSKEHGAAVDRVRAWHKQVLARGEAPSLVEIARRGDRTSYAAANRLAQLDPAAAVAPTLEGIRAARHGSFRHNLMLVLTRLPGEAGWPAVESLLAESEDIAVRFTAAEALLQRKPEVSVPVFIEVWKRPLPAAVPFDPAVPGSPMISDHAAQQRREAALFLLGASGQASAVEALEAGLASRSALARLSVVVALVAPNDLAAFQLLPIGFGGVNAVQILPMTPAAAAVVERILAGRLEDVARAGRLDLVIDGVPLDPVIGEVAAWGLARRFPQRWTYDPRAPAEGRMRGRLTAANAWRARHGKPPLPLPAPCPRPKAVGFGEIIGHFQRAAIGANAALRARALQVLGARGLAALPALREGLEKVAQNAPGRAGLDNLVRRLSLTVAQVEFAKDAPQPDAALRALLDAKIGQTFSGDLYASIFLHVAQHMPPGAAGLDLAALRENLAAGVRLEVKLIKDKIPASGTQTGWDAGGPAVQVGKRRDGGGGSFFSWAYGREAKAWADWARRIDARLAKGAPDDRITVRGHLVGTK